jgi:hypothetical protein
LKRKAYLSAPGNKKDGLSTAFSKMLLHKPMG